MGLSQFLTLFFFVDAELSRGYNVVTHTNLTLEPEALFYNSGGKSGPQFESFQHYVLALIC